MNEAVELRLHGDPAAPTLIYLPGLHGDWTLVTSFRQAVASRVRFVEFSYPRTTTWSLADYAQAVQMMLKGAGIRPGWLLAESFGSQVAWELLSRSGSPTGFEPQGLILAGGFVRHPFSFGVRFARKLLVAAPRWSLRACLWAYVQYARFRHRRAPQTLTTMGEFVRRRMVPGDRAAMAHRLGLIAAADLRETARACPVPTWFLTGFWDPIVPWPPVRAWLRRECPGWRGAQVIFWADHTVLATQPGAAAQAVLRWMKAS